MNPLLGIIIPTNYQEWRYKLDPILQLIGDIEFDDMVLS